MISWDTIRYGWKRWGDVLWDLTGIWGLNGSYKQHYAIWLCSIVGASLEAFRSGPGPSRTPAAWPGKSIGNPGNFVILKLVTWSWSKLNNRPSRCCQMLGLYGFIWVYKSFWPWLPREHKNLLASVRLGLPLRGFPLMLESSSWNQTWQSNIPEPNEGLNGKVASDYNIFHCHVHFMHSPDFMSSSPCFLLWQTASNF